MQIFRLEFVLPALFLCLSCSYGTLAITRYYDFKIDYANYTVACNTKRIVAVNGFSPGPIIRITKGDRVIVNVTNLVTSNVTIHWHGVHQRRTAWADGPAYVTQCPIQTNKSFVYNFTVPDQEGTVFWHAHIAWLRGTVYGAFIIEPPAHAALPYPEPFGDHVLTLGEWWNTDIETVEENALYAGTAAVLSDAYLINGHPGPLFNCSSNDTEIVNVVKNKTYLLRVINNALEVDLFITIANHSLTVVESDASYTKQITNTSFLISPGQTYNFLVNANQAVGQYYIVASPYQRNQQGVQETPALAILRYQGSNTSSDPIYPSKVPLINDTSLFKASQEQIRSLNSKQFPAEVPKTVDVDLFWVVSLNLEPCTVTPTSACLINGRSFASSINNITFQRPDTAILQAYYYNISGVYTSDFPSQPPTPYDYTGLELPTSSLASNMGTKVTEIPYGSNVQLVLQGTTNFGAEAHPFHLHGSDFYVVGYGDGNYNSSSDPSKFNLVDPARRNTAMLTRAGWTALRWKADNPGVWLIHCHIDGHVSWGMETVFIIKNGAQSNQTLLPPPSDLPAC